MLIKKTNQTPIKVKQIPKRVVKEIKQIQIKVRQIPKKIIRKINQIKVKQIPNRETKKIT